MVRYAPAAVSVLAAFGLSVTTTVDALEFKKHTHDLPTFLSDMSATHLPSTAGFKHSANDVIIIAGGCDDPDGNVWQGVDDPANDYFACFSLTRKAWFFDPNAGEGGAQFREIAEMPRARYRHAAVVARGKLILVGGRHVDEAMIAEIDVYDPMTDEWSTPASLPLESLTSDNAAFVDPNELIMYVVGGYVGYDYRTHSMATQVYLNVLLGDNPSSSFSRSPTQVMKVPRGDVHAVISGDGKSAYVAGGFHADNGFCEPLDTVERFDFASQEWKDDVGALVNGRGDKALVQLKGRVYAVGGENRTDDHCDTRPEDMPLLQDMSNVMEDVEVYHPKSNKWSVIGHLPENRFRFAAAAIGDSAYVFGGQVPYDPNCFCYRTSTDVFVVTDESPGVFADDSAATTGKLGLGFGAVLAGLAAGLVAFL